MPHVSANRTARRPGSLPRYGDHAIWDHPIEVGSIDSPQGQRSDGGDGRRGPVASPADLLRELEQCLGELLNNPGLGLSVGSGSIPRMTEGQYVKPASSSAAATASWKRSWTQWRSPRRFTWSIDRRPGRAGCGVAWCPPGTAAWHRPTACCSPVHRWRSG